jgi:hypothetical protein
MRAFHFFVFIFLIASATPAEELTIWQSRSVNGKPEFRNVSGHELRAAQPGGFYIFDCWQHSQYDTECDWTVSNPNRRIISTHKSNAIGIAIGKDWSISGVYRIEARSGNLIQNVSIRLMNVNSSSPLQVEVMDLTTDKWVEGDIEKSIGSSLELGATAVGSEPDGCEWNTELVDPKGRITEFLDGIIGVHPKFILDLPGIWLASFNAHDCKRIAGTASKTVQISVR